MTESRPSEATVGRLRGRRLALGITGSIAAYKAVELLRLLQAEGADVSVLMTYSATRFVAPLTLATLSRHPVDTDVLELLPDGRIGHIATSDEIDAVVVAPATAHWMAAMAIGLAGDVVTATCLAADVPVIVAPAMDGGMYEHPATRANLARLRDVFGYRIVDPGFGALASGQVGRGRMADLGLIVDATVEAIGIPPGTPPAGKAPPDLRGRHVVVTAGGTAEPIDPVRFVGNRSTGKMGAAIARAALDRGARVTLIVGRVEVPLPAGAEIVSAETTAAMGEALGAVMLGRGGPLPDALVMAAAVADFRPSKPVDRKLHRAEGLALELEATPDLLADLSRALAELSAGAMSEAGGAGGETPQRPILVGFAAETGEIGRAADKLAAKGLDLIVANDVAEAGSGFGSDTNRVTVYAPGREPEPWPLLSKREVADRLLDRVAVMLSERSAQGGSLRAAQGGFEAPAPGDFEAPAPAQEVPS